MKSKVLILLVAGLMIILWATTALTQAEEKKDQVRKAIEEMNLKFGDAMRKADATALAALYTKDATLLPPDREMVQGRQNIEEFRKSTMQRGVKEVILNTVDVSVCGDSAIEIGNYTLKIQPEGQKPIELSGKYVVVWKLQSDGSWKLHVDIWNSSMAPPPPQP